MPENDQTFCTRQGKNCGSLLAFDNCGNSRQVAFCGPCPSMSSTCIDNVCTCRTGFNRCGGATSCQNETAQTCGQSCVACESPDGGAATCSNGLCLSSCPMGTHLCNGACVSNTSTATCGSRCAPCAVPANGVATCNGLTCGTSCNPTFHDCGGQCLSNSSTASCGTSCNACPAPANGTATCDGTACAVTCSPTFHQCPAGCLSNTSTASCGQSCTPCTAPANGTASCDGTSCGFSCNTGYCRVGNTCERYALFPVTTQYAYEAVMAIDPAGLVTVAYIIEVASVRQLHVAQSTNLTTWTSTQVATTATEGVIDSLSVTTGPSSQVAVAWRAANGFVRLATRASAASAFTVETAMNTTPFQVAARFDATGAIHLVVSAYQSGTSSPEIYRYRRRSPTGTWSTTESIAVDDLRSNASSFYFYDFGLTVGPGNVPHVCYWKHFSMSSSTILLMHAERGSTWVSSQVDSASAFLSETLNVRGCDVAVSASGTPSVAFVEPLGSSVTMRPVKLATRPGSTWSTSVVDSMTNADKLGFTKGSPAALFYKPQRVALPGATGFTLETPPLAPLDAALDGQQRILVLGNFSTLVSYELTVARSCGP